MPSAVRWIESLSPWPEEFGLDRMRALLAELGEPQTRYPAIHVVGTNGKSTTTRTIETLLLAHGRRAGAYLSPHVRRWSERIRVAGEEADFEVALGRVRPAAERLVATQFEALTAAALAEFAEQEVDVAVVEAGLGGRLDATNVLDAGLVVLTNVGLDHTEVLGETREAIAAEKLAVVSTGTAVVLGEPEWEGGARANGAEIVVVPGRSSVALGVAAAETFLGRPVDVHAADALRLPGRLERRGEEPLEVWDGAHNLDGVGWLLPRLPTASWTVVAAILADKHAAGMLAALAAVSDTLVATSSTNARSLPARDLADLAGGRFERVEVEPDPERALARGRELAGPDGAVLVTGSLYLLADLYARQEQHVK
jgi:dihydrofolate synthase/folylpolyglutamate synthase